MQDFIKKLQELNSLLKAFNASTKTGMMKLPAAPKQADPLKLPGMAPKSKKDPKKMAEQLKNVELKPKIKIAANGQWKM